MPEILIDLPSIAVYPARWYKNYQAACSITFDDGTLDQFVVAAPELDARGIQGSFFIITGPRSEGVWKDGNLSRQLFSWDQARDLHSRGHEIASHTANHFDLRAYPNLAEEEIAKASETLSRELSIRAPFSFGWPYWRSSPEAAEQVRRYHYAARAGGIQAISEPSNPGTENSKTLTDSMRVGSRAILSTDTFASLAPEFEAVQINGGWLVPSFHGIDDGFIPSQALGWEALSLEVYREILDGLSAYNYWIAPFGTVARYAMQRDEVQLRLEQAGTELRIHYESRLDPSIFNHNLTLIIELPHEYRLSSPIEAREGAAPSPNYEYHAAAGFYLVELAPGSGVLILQVIRTTL